MLYEIRWSKVNPCTKSLQPIPLTTNPTHNQSHSQPIPHTTNPTHNQSHPHRTLAQQGAAQVFATDTLLTALMSTPRTVYPWDLLIVKKQGQVRRIWENTLG